MCTELKKRGEMTSKEESVYTKNIIIIIIIIIIIKGSRKFFFFNPAL
jgi:hypothetical protein